MKRLFLTGVAALFLITAPVVLNAATVDLYNLPGGAVELYWNLFQDYARDKTEVRVLGKCMSACTLVVGAIDKSRLCFGPQAMLGFHHAISGAEELWGMGYHRCDQ